MKKLLLLSISLYAYIIGIGQTTKIVTTKVGFVPASSTEAPTTWGKEVHEIFVKKGTFSVSGADRMFDFPISSFKASDDKKTLIYSLLNNRGLAVVSLDDDGSALIRIKFDTSELASWYYAPPGNISEKD